MQRDERIQITATPADCSSGLVEKVIDTFIDAIIQSLKTRERMELRTDFGNFVVRKKSGDAGGPYFTKIQQAAPFQAIPSMREGARQGDQAFEDELRAQGAALQIQRK